MSSMIRAGLAALAVSGLVLSAGGASADEPDDKSASAEVQGVGPAATDAARHAAIGE